MPTVDTLFKTIGARALPPTSTQSLDPGRDILLALLTAALNEELADRWNVAAVKSSLAGGNPVASTLRVGPERHLLRLKPSGWPLLCVYRDPEVPMQATRVTLEKVGLTCAWGVDYILGPYEPDQEHERADVLIAAADVIIATLDAGKHPAYNSGNPCLGPWDGCAGFSRLDFGDLLMGQARFAGEDDIRYHALSCSLTTLERDYHRDGAAADYTGATVHIHVGNGQESLPDTLIIRTD